MPKRQSTKRVDSAAVQGAGSWVDVRRITYGMGIDAQSLQGVTETPVLDEFNRKLITYLVAGWNWVDEDGNELPLPEAAPSVIDGLLDTEVLWLMQQLTAQTDRKN